MGDPATTSLVAFAFDLPSRADVDASVGKAEAAGAEIGATDDQGFMHQRDVHDPDGDQFTPLWIDLDGPPTK